jgi:putative salt-induced outer membrane protein
MNFMFFFFLLFTNLTIAESKFTHESELSSVVSGGNSDVETYLYKFNNRIVQRIYNFQFDGHYNYGEAADVVSARDWHVNVKLERMFSLKNAVYIAEMVEGYRFQGIRARYNSDIGLKYYFMKKDTLNIFSELGYRYTQEQRYSPQGNQFDNKGRVFSEIHDKPTTNFSYRFWVEYLPNFSQSEDWIITHEASITSILTSVFSIKFAYRGIYNNLPAIVGNQNYDYTYTTSFVARF